MTRTLVMMLVLPRLAARVGIRLVTVTLEAPLIMVRCSLALVLTTLPDTSIVFARTISLDRKDWRSLNSLDWTIMTSLNIHSGTGTKNNT